MFNAWTSGMKQVPVLRSVSPSQKLKAEPEKQELILPALRPVPEKVAEVNATEQEAPVNQPLEWQVRFAGFFIFSYFKSSGKILNLMSV